VNSHESGRIAQSLAHRAEVGADAAQIADTVVATWQAIDIALSPIIGHGSIVVLYMRSLCLMVQPHPWLTSVCESVHIDMDLDALRTVLAGQDSALAATVGGELLQTFYELLASLVGPSLTEQLLRPVWASFSSGTPAQDITP
jgi:hypothetical protein